MHLVKGAWFPGTSSGIHSWTNSKKSFLKDYGQEGYDRCKTTWQNEGRYKLSDAGKLRWQKN